MVSDFAHFPHPSFTNSIQIPCLICMPSCKPLCGITTGCWRNGCRRPSTTTVLGRTTTCLCLDNLLVHTHHSTVVFLRTSVGRQPRVFTPGKPSKTTGRPPSPFTLNTHNPSMQATTGPCQYLEPRSNTLSTSDKTAGEPRRLPHKLRNTLANKTISPAKPPPPR